MAKPYDTLAIVLFDACRRQYPEHYQRKGQPRTAAEMFDWLDQSQRELYHHYADAAREFLGVKR